VPLNTIQKINHVLAATQKAWAGRQRIVTFVYLISDAYSYINETVIMRPDQIIDPTVYTAAGNQPPQQADMEMIAALTINFVGVVFVADTPTATELAVASAFKYEIIETLPVGIVPGGSHYRVLLRRLR
jgi:hypothetical protein